MTTEERAKAFMLDFVRTHNDVDQPSIGSVLEWADAHPSDEVIMKIMNAIGYEEKTWIEVVRKNLKRLEEDTERESYVFSPGN